VLVDLEDVKKIKENAQYLSVGVDFRTNYCSIFRKDKKTQKLHRFLMDTPEGLEVDHLNYNGLDNRKVNLKNCTIGENRFRRRKNPPFNPLHWSSQEKEVKP
jgi:hypothetical protein